MGKRTSEIGIRIALGASRFRMVWLVVRQVTQGGASSEQAVRAALRDLGNLSLVREDTRAAWGWNWFEQLQQDCRYAVRGMRRNLVFTAMAALSLALGIGANAAIGFLYRSHSG